MKKSKYAEGGKVSSLIGKFVKDKKGYVYKVHDDLTKRNQVTAHDMNQDSFVLDKDQVKEVSKPKDWDETGWDKDNFARGGRIRAAKPKSPLELAAGATDTRKGAKSASVTANKRLAGVSDVLRDTDKDLAKSGDQLADKVKKFAEGGKVGLLGRMGQRQLLDSTAEKLTASGKLSTRAKRKLSSIEDLVDNRMIEDEDLKSTLNELLNNRGEKGEYAEGGKVGLAMGAIGRLASKFEEALNMGDNSTAKRLEQQMERMEPGSTEKVKSRMSGNADRVVADKLATFAKGGKVKAVGKLVSHTMELTSSPEHSIHDDLRGWLDDAGISASEHKKIKVKKYEKVDSDGDDHFYNADIEGPSEHITKLKQKLNAEGMGEDVIQQSKKD